MPPLGIKMLWCLSLPFSNEANVASARMATRQTSIYETKPLVVGYWSMSHRHGLPR